MREACLSNALYVPHTLSAGGAAGLKALFARAFSLDGALAQQRADGAGAGEGAQSGLSLLSDEADSFGFLKLAEVAARADA